MSISTEKMQSRLLGLRELIILLEKQQIRSIPSLGGAYFASDTGVILSAYTCLPMSLIENRQGYYRVEVRIRGKRARLFVHRLVAEAFLGPPCGRVVNHIDADKKNNRPDNLAYITQHENIRHAINMGLFGQKLTWEKVAEIRSLGGSMPQGRIAGRFGVSRQCVNAILANKSWVQR